MKLAKDWKQIFMSWVSYYNLVTKQLLFLDRNIFKM